VTVSVADIDRWDAGDVREVFHATRNRAEAAFEAADGIVELPAFGSWGGDASEAAKEAIGQTRKDLDAHGNEALAVARAASAAADDIEQVKSDLAQLRADAESLGMAVDPVSNTIEPGPGAVGADPMEIELKRMQLQPRLDAILAEAVRVDEELAGAIDMATGETPIPDTPHDNRPEIQDALSKPPPEDPKQFHDLWEQLTQEQKDWLYQRDHSIGNHDGMPAIDRDTYNRLTLADELAGAQAAADQAEALKAQHPDWAQGQNIPEPNKPGAIFDDRLAYEAWQRQYDAARNGAKYLPDQQEVNKAVKDNSDRKLMLLDTHAGGQARAAIAVGDPDTATHVSVTTPGLNTAVHDSIGGMTEEATNLQREAPRQLRLTPGHELETVSTIAWIGYDAPQIPGSGDLGASLSGAWDVSHDDLAKAGARDLAGFYDGLQASHEGVPAHITAIGHSYGSLTTGLALQEPGTHGVSDAIFYGSPGIEASTPQQLQLQPGHVYAMETPDDPIQWVYDSKPIAQSIPFGLGQLVGAGAEASGTGEFGPNPATNPNFTRLGTGPAVVSDGHGGALTLEGAHGHSEYPRQGGNGLPRTTGYNIAAVIAGLGATNAIPEN
jgi:Alpha/beta hydrolase